MTNCPICQFENEEGALFCEQCKSDLGVGEPVAAQPAARSAAAVYQASVIPHGPVSEVASPHAGVAIAEAALAEAVPVAQLDAVLAAAAEAPIAVAVPLPETPPLTVAPDVPIAGVALAEAAPTYAEPSELIAEKIQAAPGTAPDISLPFGSGPQEITTPPPVAEPSSRLPPEAKPKLVVVRGQRMNVEYPLYEGDNYLGRADEKAVDIDLEDQEPPDRIWSSRQHALINYENGSMTIEDLNSTNGTFVNRMRVHPGQKRPLQVNDVIQIGTVQMRVKT